MKVELWEKSILEISAAYRLREYMPPEFLREILDRVEAVNPTVNAIVTLDREGAERAAKASEERWMKGAPLSSLDGIPITVKDNIPVQGIRSTWGSHYYSDFVPALDELPIARLRAAGAVILGKTNCPEFTLQGFTDNLLFGPTRNPWNKDLTPGGSSGGAVAAVASGFGPVAIATDGGGSIRRPAAHTGLFGLKPSRGRVPRANGFPVILPDFESVGPIARCVEDLVLTMQLVAPATTLDPLSLRFLNRPFQVPSAPRSRILFIPHFGAAPVDPEIVRSTAESAATLANLGHQVTEGAVPFDHSELEKAFGVASRAGLAWLIDSLTEKEGPLTSSIAEMAASGRTVTGTEYWEALTVIRRLQTTLSELFTRYDLILTPTTAALPWEIGKPFPEEIRGQKVSPRGHAVFTGFVNLSGCPAINLPGKPASNGLPIGFQLIGPEGEDGLLCAVGKEYEEAQSTGRR